MALGLGNVLLAFWIGRRWFGRAAALVAALGMSAYWIFPYYEAEFHDVALFVLLVLLTLLMVGLWRDTGSLGAALGAGLACGLAAVVRPNAVAILVGALVWIVAVGLRRDARRWRAAAVGLLLAAAVAIAPVTARNWIAARDLVVLTSNGGVNLYIGNHLGADGFVTTEIPGFGKFRTCFDWPGIVASLEKKLGHPVAHSGASVYFAAEARRFVREHPGAFLRLTLRKALLFWGPVEVAHNKEVHFERVNSPLLRRLPGSFPLVLAFAVLGATVLVIERRRGGTSRRWEISLLLALAVVAYFVSVLPIFAAARYRVPVIPLLLLIGAYGVVRCAALLRQRRLGAVLACGLVVVAAYALATRSFAGYTPSLPRWHFDRGTDWGRIGDDDQAIASYRSALAVDPGMFEANYNLGHMLFDRGQVDAAVTHWERALRADASFAPVHANLAQAYTRAGDRARAIEHWTWASRLDPDAVRYRARLADLLFAAGDAERARAEYEAVLDASPDHLPALRNLAWILATHADPAVRDGARAVRLAEQAERQSAGRSPSVLDALAAAYVAAGRFDDAIATARRAVAVARETGAHDLARHIEERYEGVGSGLESLRPTP